MQSTAIADPLIKLLARAITGQIRRQAETENAAQVLTHPDGGASPYYPAMEQNSDAVQFYPTRV